MGRAQARDRADAAEDKLLLLSDALSLVRIEPKRLRRIPLVRLTGNWRDYGELTLAYAELTRTDAGALNAQDFMENHYDLTLGALLGLLGSLLGRLEASLGRLGALLTALKPLSRS